jgi:hypothetical protein
MKDKRYVCIPARQSAPETILVLLYPHSNNSIDTFQYYRELPPISQYLELFSTTVPHQS